MVTVCGNPNPATKYRCEFVNLNCKIRLPSRIGAVVQKWVPYSQRYLFNAIPDANHNTNPTNPNRYSLSLN